MGPPQSFQCVNSRQLWPSIMSGLHEVFGQAVSAPPGFTQDPLIGFIQLVPRDTHLNFLQFR